jgi:hypothetical protein
MPEEPKYEEEVIKHKEHYWRHRQDWKQPESTYNNLVSRTMCNKVENEYTD